jgi:hypothetical protein
MATISHWLFGIDTDAEMARGQALDNTIHQQNLELLNRGVWTQEQFDAAEGRAATGATPDVNAEVMASFKEGAGEGLTNVQQAVKSTATDFLSAGIRGVTGFIPWWLWLAGAGYLAFRLGLVGKIMSR